MSNFKYYSQIAFAILFVSFTAHSEVIAEVSDKVELSAKPAFPVAMSERPFTIPQGAFQFDTGISGGLEKEELGSRVSAAFGINDDFQVDISWDGMNWMDLKPSESMSLSAAYYIGATPFSATLLIVSMPFAFGEDNIVNSMSFHALTAFGLGGGFSIMALDELVDFHFRPESNSDPEWKGVYADFNVPVKLTYQATENIYLGLKTSLASFHTNKEQEYIWDRTPVAASMVYSFNNAIDIETTVGFSDVQRADKTFNASIGFSFRGGALGG